MPIVSTVLAVAAIASCTYWWFSSVRIVRALRYVPLLGDLAPPDPPRWPKVSLIVPACNEADTLARAVSSRLDDDYPDLEVVLVDDRSTDGTGAVVDAFAARDARVIPVHVTSLPDGWLGKLNALHAGVGHAHGEFLLFSDADVAFAPGTLRRTVALCEARAIDHLAAFPRFLGGSLWLDAAIDAFGATFVTGIDLAAIEDPRSRTAIGGGVFALVRRVAFDRTAGFEWLKLEVADDVALGQMLKDSGARPMLVNARDFVSLSWYRSIGEMARGLEKNLFGILGRYRMLQLLSLCALMTFFLVGPLAGLALSPQCWVRWVCAASLCAGLCTQLALDRWLGRNVLRGLLAPLGALMLIVMALRAGVLSLRRGGIIWRGTLYPTVLLRAGMRVRFP